MLLFIHQTEISNFQFPPCCTLKPARYQTKTPFNNKGNFANREQIIRIGTEQLDYPIKTVVAGGCHGSMILTNPLPVGVTNVSPSAPLLAEAVCGVMALRREQWMTSTCLAMQECVWVSSGPYYTYISIQMISNIIDSWLYFPDLMSLCVWVCVCISSPLKFFFSLSCRESLYMNVENELKEQTVINRQKIKYDMPGFDSFI